ncbi:hypothetical protein QYE76_061475 [Lolium multiflorum]|uniref:Integrase catalytic domain-containing protein n=1 Tax=Lolium multiflorum TaxID=4521 RepID=A0AAD8W6D1_LOLMU|nr:hypothetical protein QYE76_061475 [Lolium multiflorum]
MPHSIVTDNGSNFDSEEFRKFCDDGGIKLKFASVSHPQTNGQVERINGLIGDGLKKRLKGQHKDYLDACSEGSFTSKEVEARWDLLDRIEDNAEGWENDKGKESGYADKLPFKPLPPKEGNEEKEEKKKKKGTKKKKKKENKKKEVTAYPRVNEITLSNRKYVAPNDYCDNESEYDDLPMPFTYIRDHDLNEHTTFDIANLWETNSENDDDNNCHSVSAIHASSHNDIESSKLGEEVFENPFATDHYVFDTSPSNNNDGMVIDKPTVKDNYSISYDDTVPPIFDDYYKECYDIGYNYPYETCHSHDWITKNNSLNMQLVYHVQILDNNPAPITINEKNSSYAKINDTSMHMNHDKNVLSDGYIVDFINDAT